MEFSLFYGLIYLLSRNYWLADLSVTTSWLYDTYSDCTKGTKPRDPTSMIRSYVLYLLVQPTTSITEWVNQLRRVPLYAILSGFEPGDTPGVGTFHDFFDRIWVSDQANTKHKIQPKRKKKNKKTRPKKEKWKHIIIQVLLKDLHFITLKKTICDCLQGHQEFLRSGRLPTNVVHLSSVQISEKKLTTT